MTVEDYERAKHLVSDIETLKEKLSYAEKAILSYAVYYIYNETTNRQQIPPAVSQDILQIIIDYYKDKLSEMEEELAKL